LAASLKNNTDKDIKGAVLAFNHQPDRRLCVPVLRWHVQRALHGVPHADATSVADLRRRPSPPRVGLTSSCALRSCWTWPRDGLAARKSGRREAQMLSASG
jgi:hypothetical protein